jgi:SAM-dependent methyltransferase
MARTGDVRALAADQHASTKEERMAFEELKAKQSVMWGSGPYERIGEQLRIAHEHLLRAVPPREDEAWLDVATGTGEIALPAARAGARVTGLDLAPELIATARDRAADEGVEVQFEVGDAEALPYEDATFDTVSSGFGCMFAPDHVATARELARVCKPGGRLALLTWHPTRGVAEFFKVMAAYQPPRPDGVGNPFDWGDRDHLAELLGDAFKLRTRTVTARSRARRKRRSGSSSPPPTGRPRRSWRASTTGGARRSTATGSNTCLSTARTTG